MGRGVEGPDLKPVVVRGVILRGRVIRGSVKPISSSLPSNVRIGEKSLEVRGEQQKVAVYDFAKIKPAYAEHVDGTGYPGSYRIEAKLTDTQKVSLTVDPDGSVGMLSKHYEPDPDLGGTSTEPSRYDPVRQLFPEELKSLLAGLKGMENVDPAFATILERLGGKTAEKQAPAGVGQQHLSPSEGKPLANNGGMRGAGYDVTDKE